MNHLSEHTLERYLFDDGSIDSQRQSIEDHLNVCSQCSDAFREIRSYYDLLEQTPKQLEAGNESSFGIVVQSPIRSGISIHDSRSLPQRLWQFAKRRPVVASAWSFVLMFFMYSGIEPYVRKLDDNPVNYRYNEANNMMELFNSRDEMLWSVPINSAASFNAIKSRRGVEYVELRDLDGDKKNEIITSLDLTFEKNFRTLRVYRSDRSEMFSLDTLAPQKIQFRSIEYQKQFFSVGFKTVNVNGKTNIFMLSNNGRSPQFIARIDHQGKIIGRYWHYGQIGMIEAMDVDRDGDEEIVVLGMNDTPFPDITFGVMAVLDPAKIVGNTESKATRGFGFPVSECEIMIVRFPRSDVDIALQSQSVPDILLKEGNVLSIYLRTNELKTGVYNFEYSFLNGIDLVSVKGSDPCARIYDQLKKDGLVHKSYGDSLFEELKRSVTYFNGTDWQNKKIFLN
jgi:hypothetical protein